LLMAFAQIILGVQLLFSTINKIKYVNLVWYVNVNMLVLFIDLKQKPCF